MNAPAKISRTLLDALYRLVTLEFALVEACHSDAVHADRQSQAMLACSAGAAQVHLFDLGTVLREFGEDSLTYSRCVRQSLLSGGTHAVVKNRVERAYASVSARQDLPPGLSVLLRANALEHEGQRHVVERAEQYAA